MMCSLLNRGRCCSLHALDDGLWTGPHVAQWTRFVAGASSCTTTRMGWEYLKGLRLRLRVPRPEHQDADPQQQEAWKKKRDSRDSPTASRVSQRRRRSLGNK